MSEDIVVIDRATASSINPLISQFSVRDTLQDVSNAVRDFGYFISTLSAQADAAGIEIEPNFKRIFLLTNVIGAALDCESNAVRRSGSADICTGDAVPVGVDIGRSAVRA